jgi:hypothetical protein
VRNFPSSLDGVVGVLSVSGTAAAGGALPPARPEDLRLCVFISGAGSSDPDAVGLDEDIRLLVNDYVRRARTSTTQPKTPAPASQGHGDVHIALHGLNLTAEQASELRQLISDLIAKRAASGGATP